MPDLATNANKVTPFIVSQICLLSRHPDAFQ
jgi:hypothetical protein